MKKIIKQGNFKIEYWGICDLQGELIAPFSNAVPFDFINGLTVVRNGPENYFRKHGVLKNNGQLIVPIIYDQINIFDKIISCGDKESHMYFLYNYKGEKIRSRAFNNWGQLTNSIFYFYENNKKGVIKLNGKETNAFYDEIVYKDAFNGFIKVTDKTKVGLLDTINLEVVLPCEYDNIEPDFGHTFIVQKNGLYGLLDSKANFMIACNLKAKPISNEKGYHLFSQNNKMGCVDDKGEYLIKPMLDEKFVETNFNKIKTEFEKVLSLFPYNEDLLNLYAYGKYKNSTIDESLSFLTELINKPLVISQSLYKIRSAIYFEKNMLKESESDCRKSRNGKLLMKIGDVYYKNDDLNNAKSCYLSAQFYDDSIANESKQKYELTLQLMKNRGIYIEPKKNQVTANTDLAIIPVGLKNFTLRDESEYMGDYYFNYLFTYKQATKNCPNGYRIPTLTDWLNLLNYIIKDSGISYGHEHSVIYSIGNGWRRSYNTKQGVSYKTEVFESKDVYGLNISPMNNSENWKTYWLQPETYNGKMVNAVTFSNEGYEFKQSSNESTKACVRYVKIK